MSALTGNWAGVVAWCASNAPVTAAALRPPAGDGRLPSWFALHNGLPEPAGSVLPGYRLLSATDSAAVSDELAELMADQYEASYFDPDQRSIARGESEPAGSEATMFLPSFLPIGSAGEHHLFVDTRSGPQSGCITGWDHSAADQAGPMWPNLAAMLAEIAGCLRTGAECAGFAPFVSDGVLGWTQV